MANQPLVVELSTQVFVKSGEDLVAAIYERSKRHTEERSQCIQNIATILMECGDEENQVEHVAGSAATLLVALKTNEGLKGQALVAQAWVDRAAFLTKEVVDLKCIAKNIDHSAQYRVSLDDAKRYGLL